jgi:hypothetical protein
MITIFYIFFIGLKFKEHVFNHMKTLSNIMCVLLILLGISIPFNIYIKELTALNNVLILLIIIVFILILREVEKFKGRVKQSNVYTRHIIAKDIQHFYAKRCRRFRWGSVRLEEKINIIQNYLYHKGSIGVCINLINGDYIKMMNEEKYIPSSNSVGRFHTMTLIGWKNDTWILRNTWGKIGKNKGYCYWKMGENDIEDNLFVIEI